MGRGGKRGSYSGKGIKGQKARAGRRIRPQIREAIKKIHKRRGYFSKSHRSKPAVVNIASIEKKFKEGERVTPKLLIKAGLLRRAKGQVPAVKILGDGKVSKKFVFDKDILISLSLKSKLEK